MYERLRWAWGLVCLLGILPLAAQRYGYLPPSVKWQELRHDSIRVIFPKGQAAEAGRVAAVMLKLAALDPITTEGRYRQIPVILQPQTNLSNGAVSVGPYKAELLLQPSEKVFELGSLPWADLLSLHEYRHVQQLNAVNDGISHIVKMVAGDLAYGAVYTLALPQWFREGNAVFAETKWSPQGRGRLSSFMLPTHERLLTKEPWRYYKALRGSYKEVTPDVYSLGFQMQIFGNSAFGEAAWDTIVRRSARLRNPFNALPARVRDYYGDWSRGIYRDASYWLRDRYRTMAGPEIAYPEIKPDTGNRDSRFRQHDYLNYTYPVIGDEGHVFATVSTFDHIPAIYALDKLGYARRIRILGQKQDGHFHARAGRFVWSELRLDPRWPRRDYSVMIVYTASTHRRIVIRPEKGYYMPGLDSSGQRIAALHADRQGRYAIHVLDAGTGEVLQALPNPDNLYFGYPSFSGEGRSLIASARLPDGRMSLIEIDLSTGRIDTLTPPTYSVLGRPAIAGDVVYLTAGYDRIDQVYAVDRDTRQVHQVTFGNRAHYNPDVDIRAGRLICSEYRLDGSKLVEVSLDRDSWRSVMPSDTIRQLAFPDARNLVTEDLKIPTAEIHNYGPWRQAIHPHSLFLQVTDPVWRVMVRSDNLLNSISSAAGMEVNTNLKSYGPFFNARLAMWYPEIHFGGKHIFRDLRPTIDSAVRVTNTQVHLGVRVPLQTTAGAWSQSLSVGPAYTLGRVRETASASKPPTLRFDYLEHELLFTNAMRRGYRQALPAWAQRIHLVHAHQVFESPVTYWYGAVTLTIPSFFTTHYGVLHGEYQYQANEATAVSITSRYDGARGFAYTDGQRQYNIGLTYGFPLLYPDVGLGGVMFTQRIRLQTFMDVAHTLQFDKQAYVQASAGLELIVDSSWLPFSLGFRFARLFRGPSDYPSRFEIFVPQMQF